MGEGVSVSESLGSVWSPFYILSALVRNLTNGQFVTHGFDTLVATLTVWIPSEVWSNKPEAWGRSLAWEFNRQAAANSTHSEAGLLPAEMLWSFGLIGLIVGIPLIGVMVRYINSRLQVHARILHMPGRAAAGVLVWIAFATALLPLSVGWYLQLPCSCLNASACVRNLDRIRLSRRTALRWASTWPYPRCHSPDQDPRVPHQDGDSPCSRAYVNRGLLLTTHFTDGRAIR